MPSTMSEQNIIEWLKQARRQGVSDMQIQARLKSAGWSDEKISQVLHGDYALNGQNIQKQDLIISKIATLPNITELTKKAWALYRWRYKHFLIIGFIFFLIELLLYGISSLLVGGSFFINLLQSGAIESNPIAYFVLIFIVIMAMAIVSSLIIGIFFAWLQGTVVDVLQSAGPKISLVSAMRRTLKLTFPIWWVVILSGFFTAGAAFLLIIPGIIFSVWFSLAFFLPVTENVRGWQALLKSKEYVRGLWLPVFTSQIAFCLMFGAAVGLISLILGLLLPDNVSAVIEGIIYGLFIPFALTYYYVIYQEIKKLKGDKVEIPKKKGGLIVAAICGWLIIPLIFVSLAGIGLLTLSNSKIISRDTVRKTDLYSLQKILIMYHDDNQGYPGSLSDLEPKYAATVPTDPGTKKPYEYTLLGGGEKFNLCADLELKPETGQTKYCLTDSYSPPIYNLLDNNK